MGATVLALLFAYLIGHPKRGFRIAGLGIWMIIFIPFIIGLWYLHGFEYFILLHKMAFDFFLGDA